MELAQNLRVESVARLLPSPPRVLNETDPVSCAVHLMQREQVGCVVVCFEGRIVGVFTERDLMCRVLGRNKPLTTPLRDVMTPDPLTVEPQTPIGIAVRRMQEGGHRHLPVVSDSGHPVGILSVKRITHYLVEHYPAIYTLPWDSSGPAQAEGA